ncbi:hypothetical protein Tco_1505840 [Tanacetum coccineum]
MLRQQCTSGDEIQYHIDQMQNFLKNDIVWESWKKILVSPFQQKPTLVVQSCQRDPKAPALSLVNQDLLYLKKGNSGSEKIVLSLHKFPAVIFPDDDIEERNSKWELGHEHKFITEIIARRENGSIVSITKLDYKNLNKNDIEDMYLLIVNKKVDDYAETRLLWYLSVFIRSIVIWERVHNFQLCVESYQQNVNITASTITFPSIEKYEMFSIVSESVYGIIYKNSKKEKRVMRHQEIHKFCDATLKRVLEELKSYNNDVKYGYATTSLSKEDVEYLLYPTDCLSLVSGKHFKTLSLDELRSPGFNLFSDQEDYSEEKVAETMAETMEQYMSKTRADYGSGVARPKIEDKDHFELKGQFLKEL